MTARAARICRCGGTVKRTARRHCSQTCAWNERRRPTEVRFWSKVDRRGPDDCWTWTAARDKDGYGHFSINTAAPGGRAHRASWVFANGPVPPGLCVCHRCDNPPCVNPGHLFLGTNSDNMRDREAKGRRVAVVGSAHGIAKLSESQVASILRRVAAGELRTAVAKDLGVHLVTVTRIVTGETWRHVPMENR